MNRIIVAACIALALCSAACKQSPEVRRQQAFERGKKLATAKDYTRAILEFRNAVKADPKHADTYHELGMALLATGDIQGAYAAFRTATDLNPGHAAAQIKVSELLTNSNDPGVLKEAAKRMETILSSSPADSEALTALAFTELKLGEMDEAEQHLSEAVESGPANLSAAIGLAHVRISQNKVAEAEEILRRVANQTPLAATPHVVLGQFYIGTKKDLEAKREFQRALQIDSGNPAALLFLGSLHRRAGEQAEADAVYKRLAALPDKKYRTVHAAYLFDVGKRDEGIRELEGLVTADASDRPARRRLVAAYLSAGRKADAERVLTEALKRNGKDTDALLQQSAILMADGKVDDAYNGLVRVVEFEPNSAEAHYMLSRVHALRQNRNTQRQSLADAVRLNPELLPARLDYVRLLIASNAAKTALDVLDQTPEWQKRNTAVVAQRNWVLAAMGRKDEMRQSVQASLAKTPSADLLIQDALLKLDAGNFAAARTVLEDVLRKSPEDLRALDLLAQSYAAKGQIAAAVRRIRDQAAAYPKSARLQHQLGTWLARSGAPDEARAAFRNAKTADNSFWMADLALASVELSESKTESAKSLLQPLADHPQAGLQARTLLGMAEDSNRNSAAAIDHYRKILQMQPDNILALNNLAYALTEHANAPDEALKFAERAKELAGHNPTIDDTLGWIYYRKGLHRRAIQHLEMAVQKQPTAVRHAHLAMAYAANGDAGRGLDQLQAAMKLNPTLPEIGTAQKALAGAR